MPVAKRKKYPKRPKHKTVKSMQNYIKKCKEVDQYNATLEKTLREFEKHGR
jgi:hypothetical protein